MKHSPGPWGVHGSHIYASDGAIIAQVHNPGSKEKDYSLVANRNLMGAAPDLLAMLKVAQLWLDVDGRFDMQGINAAIAKAEGGAA
jgi:hypothetical protein